VSDSCHQVQNLIKIIYPDMDWQYSYSISIKGDNQKTTILLLSNIEKGLLSFVTNCTVLLTNVSLNFVALFVHGISIL